MNIDDVCEVCLLCVCYVYLNDLPINQQHTLKSFNGILISKYLFKFVFAFAFDALDGFAVIQK